MAEPIRSGDGEVAEVFNIDIESEAFRGTWNMKQESLPTANNSTSTVVQSWKTLEWSSHTNSNV